MIQIRRKALKNIVSRAVIAHRKRNTRVISTNDKFILFFAMQTFGGVDHHNQFLRIEKARKKEKSNRE